MSNLDQSSTSDLSTYQPSNKQAAWVAIVYASAMVDGVVTESEMDAMSKLLMFKEIFLRHEIINYFREIFIALQTFPPKVIIDAAAHLIPGEEAPTLFCLVTETLLSDGVLEEDEQEILLYLALALRIELTLATTIIDVIKIRNLGNYNFS